MTATDADKGSNARLAYHIVDGNHDNAFVIEPAYSGTIKTNIVLDREIRDSYRLTVIVTDEGIPQLTGTAMVKVNIIDVNDNQPTFPPHSSVKISESEYNLCDRIRCVNHAIHKTSFDLIVTKNLTL